MKPVYQTKFGGADAPEEEQGNCIAACLASIVELTLEEVPDFSGGIMNGRWYFRLQSWLGDYNLSVLILDKEGRHDLPDGYAMAGVTSETLGPLVGHMVVIRGGLVVHDPNPNATRKPDDYVLEEVWAFTVLDPARRT